MSIQVHFINPNNSEEMKKIAEEFFITAALKKIRAAA